MTKEQYNNLKFGIPVIITNGKNKGTKAVVLNTWNDYVRLFVDKNKEYIFINYRFIKLED